jgi:hypothetical protein
MTVFWDVALMMEATSTSETSVNFYQTTRRKSQRTVIFLIQVSRMKLLGAQIVLSQYTDITHPVIDLLQEGRNPPRISFKKTCNVKN